MGRGKSNLEESHEEQERRGCDSKEEERGGRDAGALDGKRRGDGAGGARLRDSRKTGEAGNGAKQILLQHQGADARRPGTAQAIEREIDGGAEGSRGDGKRVRVSV